jgi:hypothetical protein
MLTLTFGTLILVTSPSSPAAAHLATIPLKPFNEQATLPSAAAFFLPGSSTLSPVAADIIARAARNVGSGTICVVQASSDHEAGETLQTALDRANAVRRELIRDGVAPSAIRVVQAGTSRTGIESRRVVLSVIPAASNIPGLATVGAPDRSGASPHGASGTPRVSG